MQRAFSIALSLAAVVLSAVLAFQGPPRSGPGAAVAAEPATRTASDAGAVLDGATLALDAGSVGFLEPASEPPPVEVPEGGFRLADGTPVPVLGRGAPKQVRFGVVLVTYEGAEGAPEKGARHKSDALSAAQKLADEARQSGADFRAIVQRGDTGSSDDVGDVSRGVLEPASEAVLFALPVGAVSGVVDTPRGFWIVKRLE